VKLRDGILSLEDVKVFIQKYKDHYLYKEKLHNSILELSSDGGKAVGGAKETQCNIHSPPATKEIKAITDWIGTLFYDASNNLVQSEIKSLRDVVIKDSGNYSLSSETSDESNSGWSINPNGFRIYQCWGLVYGLGDSTFRHNHVPFSLTFCYYINMPEGSSPLCVGDNKYTMKEGECIIFPGAVDHGAENNKCEDRTVLVGNVVYYPE